MITNLLYLIIHNDTISTNDNNLMRVKDLVFRPNKNYGWVTPALLSYNIDNYALIHLNNRCKMQNIVNYTSI